MVEGTAGYNFESSGPQSFAYELDTLFMSVFISNLDDFISPGQACVNPLVLGKGSGNGNEKEAGEEGAKESVKIDIGRSLEYEPLVPPVLAGEANLIKRTQSSSSSESSAKVATVSLNDCLACSGCVTSAETVLIQQQSVNKLMAKLAQAKRPNDIVVMSMSPQSRASIASHLGISSNDAFLRISTVMKSMGIYYVVDVASAADVALLEAREQFMERRSIKDTDQGRAWEKPRISVAYSKTRLKEMPMGSNDGRGFELVEPIVAPLPATPVTTSRPMIISSCPGWVCYAEKTQPEVIPYLCTVKSAQQILGQLLKRRLAMTKRFTAKNLFLVSIQPCFDKKLEASRLDFYDEDDDSTEVDLVLSSTELWELLEIKAKENNSSSVSAFLQSVKPDAAEGDDEIENMFRCYSADGERFMTAVESNRGSGGYLEYIMRYAAAKDQSLESGGTVFDKEGEPLPYQVGRNADIAEVSQHGMKFAKIYGFRNIQSLILKLKRGKCDYDFVEVMACPSGCLNGGGQLRQLGAESPKDIRQRVSATEAALDAFPNIVMRRPEDSPLVQWTYARENLSNPLSKEALRVLHTRYHHVPKIEELAPLAATW